jgi:peroxiredoxin Q/BCP
MSEKTIELKVGDIAPDFCLPDKDNQDVCLKDFRGKKHVILYFYPMDNTPGCTIEGIEFTTILPDFQTLDATVIGISPDSPKSHTKFIERKKLKVTLLSDVEKTILKQYGVWGKVTLRGNEFIGVIRTTFLIDPEGKIIHIWPNVNAKGHAEEVKEKLAEILERA